MYASAVMTVYKYMHIALASVGSRGSGRDWEGMQNFKCEPNASAQTFLINSTYSSALAIAICKCEIGTTEKAECTMTTENTR